jgi:hypothetical protein
MASTGRSSAVRFGKIPTTAERRFDREVPMGQHVLSRLLKQRRLRKAGAQPIGDFLELGDRDALVDVILRLSATPGAGG